MKKFLTINPSYAGILLILVFVASSHYLFIEKYEEVHKDIFIGLTKPELQQEKEERTVWISSAVCWSSNTKFHKKEQFPYKLATQLSTKLWHLKTHYSTVVYVIYEDHHKTDAGLEEYIADMRSIATKVEAMPAGDVDCSLKAQMQRFFAFRLPYIGDHDIIVTTDVDAFVIDPDIFAPELSRDFKIWIFQYDSTIKSGYAFPMCFLAMRSLTWRRLVSSETPEELLEVFRNETFMPNEGINTNSMWDLDQLLLTRLILSSGLCNVPADNEVWKRVGLDPNAMPRNDTETVCFKGWSKWSNCNKSRTKIATGCKWWHFYPEDRKGQLWKVFRTIARL